MGKNYYRVVAAFRTSPILKGTRPSIQLAKTHHGVYRMGLMHAAATF